MRTGGREKERFTAQLNIYKNDDKDRPFIIFKAACPPPCKQYGNKNSVTYEIHHTLPDHWGNHYPPGNDCYITVSPSAKSNGELSAEILRNCWMDELGIDKNGRSYHISCMPVDDYKGHSEHSFKQLTLSMSNVLKFEIMAGGITPKAQPLDVLINKV